MKNLLILSSLVLAFYNNSKAQTTNTGITEHTASIKDKDDAIKANIIDPAEQATGDNAPDWAALSQTITQKYDASTADRTVTKAKIYFYYNKDWPKFCAGILHYTDNYELANDYPLLNKNAGMILKNSNDKEQLKEALKWSKAALAGDPGNATYQNTVEALTAKISAK